MAIHIPGKTVCIMKQFPIFLQGQPSFQEVRYCLTSKGFPIIKIRWSHDFYESPLCYLIFILKMLIYAYRTWRSQLAFVVKANSQSAHWYGRSPLWVLRCRMRVLLSALLYGHNVHWYGVRPWWLRSWAEITQTSISTLVVMKSLMRKQKQYLHFTFVNNETIKIAGL